MSAMASQVTGVSIVYSVVYSGADQRKHQTAGSLAFVRGIHRWPVNSPHKGPVTRKKVPFGDVIMGMILLLRIPRSCCLETHLYTEDIYDRTVLCAYNRSLWTFWYPYTVNPLYPNDALWAMYSDKGLLPERHQVINWTNSDILSIAPLGTNFGEAQSNFDDSSVFQNVVCTITITLFRRSNTIHAQC